MMKWFACLCFMSLSMCQMGGAREVLVDNTHKDYIRHFYLVATQDANQDMAVAVDVVFAGHADLAKELSTMSATQYFSRRHQMLRDYPHQMMISTWEVVPGQSLEEHLTDTQTGVHQAFVFANYKTPGIHRMALHSAPSLVIYLGRNDFKVAVPS